MQGCPWRRGQVQGRRSGVCSTSRHPGLGVSLTRVVLAMLQYSSLICFCTRTNAPRHPRRTPTLTSTPTNTHFARRQRFACTKRQILDEMCTPTNHKQRQRRAGALWSDLVPDFVSVHTQTHKPIHTHTYTHAPFRTLRLSSCL